MEVIVCTFDLTWSVSDVHDFCPLSFVASHYTHYTSPAAAEQCSMEVDSPAVAAAAAEPIASPVPLVAADLQPPMTPSIWLHHVRLHGWRRRHLSLPMAPTLIDAPVMCARPCVGASSVPPCPDTRRASNREPFVADFMNEASHMYTCANPVTYTRNVIYGSVACCESNLTAHLLLLWLLGAAREKPGT
jgi:hypothetical protein